MDFSLFDEAARDFDAEAAERRTALVRTAVKEEIFPFLAQAASDVEYAHRKALAFERLGAIAQRCEASLADVEGCADRMYGLLVQSRQQTAQARLQRSAAMTCKNCDHASLDHSEGLQCASCGCANFTPKSASDGTGHPSGHNASRKEGRRVTAENEEGPFS